MTLYLRSRRIGLALTTIALLTIANLITGDNLFTLTIGVDPVIIPYHHVLSAFIATTVINSLASPLAATDEGDTGVLQKARWLHLIALSAIGLLLATASSATGTGPETLEGARAYLAWSGLALLAAGLLRESLSWTGVLLGIFIIIWFGSPDGEHAPWNWAQAPPEASASWWARAPSSSPSASSCATCGGGEDCSGQGCSPAGRCSDAGPWADASGPGVVTGFESAAEGSSAESTTLSNGVRFSAWACTGRRRARPSAACARPSRRATASSTPPGTTVTEPRRSRRTCASSRWSTSR